MTLIGELPHAGQVEVDGVPVFWSPSTGASTAALCFRVGLLDEALPRSGVTHIVEHLALSSLGQQAFQFNGHVDETRTMFYASGSDEQLGWFLQSVCTALSALPVSRLEAERRVLQVEESKREPSTYTELALWRFGALGPGLVAMTPCGLQAVSPAEAQAWAASYFNRSNCAVWISGRVPAGLRLPLPGGDAPPRRRAPEPHFALPARIPANTRGVALTMLFSRQQPTGAIETVLRRRLFQCLRVERALSYEISVTRHAIDEQTMLLFAAIDGLPDSQDEVERCVLEVLDDLAAGSGPTTEEISEWRSGAIKAVTDSSAAPGLLNLMANDLLGERPLSTSERLLADFEAYDVDAAKAQLREGMETLLVAAPPRSAVFGERLPLAPSYSTGPAIDGYRARPVDPSDPSRLSVGPAGIQLAKGGHRLVISWSTTAAVLRFTDGGRRVVGHDATTLDVDPRQWRKFPELQAEIDRFTPTSVCVDAVPAPSRAPLPTPSSKRLGTTSSGALSGLAAGLVAVAVLGLFSGAPGLVLAVPFGCACLPIIWELALRARHKRRHRRVSRVDGSSRQRSVAPAWAAWTLVGLGLLIGIVALATRGGDGLASPAFMPAVLVVIGVRELRRRNATRRRQPEQSSRDDR